MAWSKMLPWWEDYRVLVSCELSSHVTCTNLGCQLSVLVQDLDLLVRKKVPCWHKQEGDQGTLRQGGS
jgi:hypothetical protein